MKSAHQGSDNIQEGESSTEDTDPQAPSGFFASTQLGQSMGTYLPATVAFRLVNFGRILILTWFMTRQQFGLLAMILLVVNVLTPLCSFGPGYPVSSTSVFPAGISAT